MSFYSLPSGDAFVQLVQFLNAEGETDQINQSCCANLCHKGSTAVFDRPQRNLNLKGNFLVELSLGQSLWN